MKVLNYSTLIAFWEVIWTLLGASCETHVSLVRLVIPGTVKIIRTFNVIPSALRLCKCKHSTKHAVPKGRQLFSGLIVDNCYSSDKNDQTAIE